MRGCAWGQGSHSSLITLASLSQRKRGESHMRRAQMCRSGHSSTAGLAAPPRSPCPAQHRFHRVRKARRVPAEMDPGHWPLVGPQQRVPTCPSTRREPWHVATGSSCGAAGSARSRRGAAAAARRALPAPASHAGPPSTAEARGEAAAPATPLRRHVRFTARPPLFKDSRSRLRWGLQKEPCVEAANL